MSTTSAVTVQRVWRGVRARRQFTELLLSTLNGLKRDELSGDGLLRSPEDAAAVGRSGKSRVKSLYTAASIADTTPAAAALRRRSAPASVRAGTPSLEEALEEARTSQFHHPGSPRTGPVFLRANTSEDSVDSDVPEPTARFGAGPPSPQSAVRASAAVASTPAAAVASTPAALARLGKIGALGSNPESVPTTTEDLQFTEELAADLGVEALRELASVLGRLSASRNKLLASLVERRGELMHEREQRQTMVEQLLIQVDRSRSLRSKSKKPAKRSDRRGSI